MPTGWNPPPPPAVRPVVDVDEGAKNMDKARAFAKQIVTPVLERQSVASAAALKGAGLIGTGSTKANLPAHDFNGKPFKLKGTARDQKHFIDSTYFVKGSPVDVGWMSCKNSEPPPPITTSESHCYASHHEFRKADSGLSIRNRS